MKANPGLRQADAFRPGLVVNVPDMSELGLKPATAGKDPAAGLPDALKAAVSGYRVLLANSLDAAQADVERQQQLLRRKDISTAIDAADGAAELAGSLAANLEARRKAITEEKRSIRTVFAKIARDLDALH